MVDIIAKLMDLSKELETKIAEVSAKSKDLDNELKVCKDGIVKNTLKTDELLTRESKIKSIEDIIKISEESKARLAYANDIKSEAEELIKSAKEKSEQNIVKAEELSKMIALYRSKNESLEKEKVQLEADRKAMRIKIIDELKNLK